ncbi:MULTISPECIES: oligoendopeptidase F [unclassified Streptococcus]|uniref:oligoendopeptidase F n=1 Tax=unclassified Streptococcus TaxID=2608887 RepID=UPI0010726DAB|nr:MULTISPECIES: oligoendopeptidase F [unclassified Streptococcus]MBF0805435.1 oligoendopeptidase F [Streptococcus sp. 19428wA2_WM07]TFU29050.1 oligoendopeptidase F [Streptococcus sp. WM07]
MSKERNEINVEYTWDLTSVFADDQAWRDEFVSLEADVAKGSDLAGHLLDSAQNLLEITELQLSLMRRLEKLYVYASMKQDEDTRVSAYQELYSQINGLYARFGQTFAFYEPEFMAVTKEQLESYMAEEPGLNLYRHYFDRLLFQKEHVLSPKEEALLAGASEIFGSASEMFEILDNADIVLPFIEDENGDAVQLTHGNYIHFMESDDRRVRKDAYEALYSVYEQYQHTYAKTLQTTVKVHNYQAQVRNYQSARQAALAANFIPESVYDTLLKAVNRHLPLLHRYVALKARILGLDDIRMYDIYTPLSRNNLSISYEESLEKSKEVLAVLGDDYLSKVKDAFDNRWIDVYENKGKRSGAYSGGSYDTKAYMLLNWQDNLDNLYTLVHETGHSMHSSYSRETQPYVYGDYSIFLAEIASTTNENILTEKLLASVEDKESRFAILNHYLDGFRGTVFRQTQFAEFEQLIHKADQEGQVLTSDFLNQTYGDLNAKYYGLSVEENPQIQYEWARIPHFYYNYYVFQYATGFAAASALADKIVHGTDEDGEAYINYLKAGNSDYPLAVISKAGVNMEVEDYLNDAFAVFERRLDELENLAQELGVL